MTTIMHDPSDFYRALEEHSPEDPLIVDFDETLWLRNSTEAFLDSVRPRFLAAIVLQILGYLKPWRLFQWEEPHHYRDWMRVAAVMIVAPWSLWLWRKKARTLGPRYVNKPLLDAVRAKKGEGVVVVSFGFRELVTPLLAAIDPDLPLIESCHLRSGARLRISGKANALQQHIGAEALSRALIITDSEVDRDLLDASTKSFLVQWPDARFEQAGLNPLMPFAYLQRVKRPDENYFRNAILGHDLPVLLLAFALPSDQPLLASAAILLYVIGFFTAYEVGYHENDRLGVILEKSPKVSENFFKLGHNFSPGFAWGVAILLTGTASFLAYEAHSWIPDWLGEGGFAGFFAVWAAFLIYMLTMRLLFRWQNVIEPQGRIVPMLGLQVGRVLGYAVILPTTVIGAIFCVAHGLSRWIPYVVYRFGGSRRNVPNHLNCFMLLILMAAAVAMASGAKAFLNWQSALIFAYASVRAGKDFLSFRSQMRPLTPAAESARTKSSA